MNSERHPTPVGPAIADGGATAREDTFRRIYEEHYGSVLAYCVRRLDHADAQDAAAEVFATAWRKVDETPDGEPTRAWLFAIAYRVVGHHWRSRRRATRLRNRVAHLRRADEAGPESVAIGRSGQQLVLRAAERLRPADQEILRLAGWEQLPHAEIAAVLGVTVGAVDQRFHRAKQRLAAEYQRLQPHDGPTTEDRTS